MKNARILSLAIIASAAMLISSCGSNTAKDSGEQTTSSASNEQNGPELDLLTVDTGSSSVKWTGEMLGLYSHYGEIGIKEGFLKMEDASIVEGTIIIDMTSIKPLDDGYTDKAGGRAQDLVGHLSSPDFFDVANHPEAGFSIESVDGTTATGKLKIRGTNGQETVENVQITKTDAGYDITGEVTFNRKNYGAMFDMPVAD